MKMGKQKTYSRQYNIYCDESSVENPSKYFVIGAIFIPRDQKDVISQQIKDLKQECLFKREIKWKKVTDRFVFFYQKIIDYFASNIDLEFKCIVVDKKKVDLRFHGNDNELMFYKFYYQLLRHKFRNNSQYYIFTDIKTRSFKPRFKQLREFLIRFSQEKNINVNIKHMQEYNSEEIILLQLSDFLTGLAAFANNNKLRNSAKGKLINYLETKLGVNLQKGTGLYFEKFNIFKWEPHQNYENN
jgi:hypothetical protein